MNLWQTARIALRALHAHRLRSTLTMLGVIIGVAAVILPVAIGNGVRLSVNERLEPLANLIIVKKSEGNAPSGGAPRELIDADVTALEEHAPDVATVLPVTAGQVVAETPTGKSRVNVLGSTERWLEVNDVDMAAGSSSTHPRSVAVHEWSSWATRSRPTSSVPIPPQHCAERSGLIARTSGSSGFSSHSMRRATLRRSCR